MLRLGLVLTVVGYGPLLATSTILTSFDQLIPIMLAFTVGPLGIVCLAVAAILFLVALVQRPKGPS